MRIGRCLHGLLTCAMMTAATNAAPLAAPSTNLELHLEANLGVVVDPATGEVSQWDDQSANGHVFTLTGTDANLPDKLASQLNGLPAIDFGGDILRNATKTLDLGNDSTVYIVLAPDALPGGSGQRFFGNWADWQYRYVSGQAAVRINNNDNILTDTTDISTSYHLLSYRYNDNVEIGVNDNPLAEVNASAQPGLLTTRSVSVGGVWIDDGGFNPNTIGGQFDGKVAEVLIYNTALGASEQQAVLEYLGAKYVAPVQPVVTPYSDNQSPTVAALYHMNGNGADASGNGFDLSATTSPFAGVNGPNGLGEAAGAFDSTSKRLVRTLSTQADVDKFNTQTFTIEAWVRNPELDGHDHVFGYRDGGDSRVSLRVGSNGQLGLAFQDATTPTSLFTLVTSTNLTWDADTWYHIAVTYEGDGAGNDSIVNFFRTALDDLTGHAQLVNTVTGVKDLAALTPGGQLQIGNVDGITQRNFGGDIDEVRYTNAALAAYEFNLALPEAVPAPAALPAGLVMLSTLALRRRR
ncbi:LamG domain-containing protein [Planctomycetales bacterium ZRK34]|nr:LamG domain-containing protein [Planctomycetales bacterium ZRK34]